MTPVVHAFQPIRRLGCLFFLTILSLCRPAAADVIYRETFGIPPGASADAAATVFDWQRFDNNGLVISGAAVNFNAVGRLADVTNFNAGPNADGTYAAYTNGIFYMAPTPSPSLGITTEFSFDPANYVPGSIVFTWYEGNNTTPHSFRLIVRVGGQWYVSVTNFATAAVSLANFGTQAELKTVNFNPSATNWLTLNFNGGYTPGPTNGTGTATNSTLGSVTLGSAPGASLAGPITGFGVYGDNGGTGSGNRRIDTFTIQATPGTAPQPPAVVASNQTVGLPLNSSVVIALNAASTNHAPLTFHIVSAPSAGTLGSLNSNLVTYTAATNYAGPDSFTFTAADGSVTSAVATVSLVVTNVEILYPPGPQLTRDGTAVLVEDYVPMPLSSRTIAAFGETNIDFGNQLARVNFLRFEPANAPLSAARFFVCDNNRDLYIVDRTGPLTTNSFTPYINFEKVFGKFDNDPGYAGGLVSFQFDPGYATNGIFYTVHTEDPAKTNSAIADNTYLPGLNTNGYTTTPVVNPPVGSTPRQSVLVEWTDTNVTDSTFQGTAREILRVGFNNNIHPMGDLLFNPLAGPGDSDYRNLYIANGDGGAGESSSTRTIPQRLDALQGKILRITPDLNLRTNDELSANGRYRIPTTGPDPNPFVSLSLGGLKKEIFAYGFRNCHRISWDPVANVIVENDIGLHSWEEVNLIHKGANYGYSEREGTEQLFVGGANNGKTGSQITPMAPFPVSDGLTVTGVVGTVKPVYPVAQYSHEDGDAIASGFVYRGSLMPFLRGKYLFGDITTGRIFYCDLAEMMARDDGVRTSVATVRELQVVFNGRQRRMFDVISEAYHARGGTSSQALPGSANATATNDIDGIPYGKGRADIRLAMDNAGELYVLSKSDGMIRRLAAVLVPPSIRSASVTNGIVTLGWQSISNRSYRAQYVDSIGDTNWTDVPGDVTATGGTASKTDAAGPATRFYRLVMP